MTNESGRPTRVAVLAPRYSPHIGGVERYAERIAHALRDAEGFEPVVVTTRHGWKSTTEVLDGVTVVRLGAPLHRGATPFNPLWFWQIPRLLRRLNVDVVNAHAPGPGFAELTCFRSAGRPVVFTYHSGTMCVGGRADPLLRTWERWVLPRAFARAARLVAASPVALSYDTGRAAVIPGGVDTTVFTPSYEPRSRSIVYVGRIEVGSRWKGLQVLFDSLPKVVAKIPDVTVEMVGDGDDVRHLRAQAEELGVGDRIRWHGAVSQPEVAAVVRNAGVAVLPSLTEAESFGMAVIEALAAGTPVVGSDVGGIPLNIRHGVDGLLVPPGDVDALADALVTILADPELAERMGVAARESAVANHDVLRRDEAIMEVLTAAAAEPQ